MTETSVVVPTRSHVVLFGHRVKDASTPSPSNNNAQRKQQQQQQKKAKEKKEKESKCGFEGAVLLPGVKKDTFP